MTPTQPYQPSIMVVDDEPANLTLLEKMLFENGYQVRSFPRGRMALAAAALHPPDLILLDVNMPEMTGYEVCEQLKGDATLAEIPILFLSAIGDAEGKVQAFRSGGVDFISKPFQFEEVYARVETHLKLHSLQSALKKQNEVLEQTVKVRTSALAEANAQLTLLDSAKDDFLRVISHELRTPLNGLLGASGILFDEIPDTDHNNQLRKLHETSRQRLMSLLDDAMLLTELGTTPNRIKSSTIALSLVINLALERIAAFARSRCIVLRPSSTDIGSIQGDEELLVRALHSILETAVKLSKQFGTLNISGEIAETEKRIVIESRGEGIPEIAIPKFFDVFSTAESYAAWADLGLGPPLASRIFALFHGKTSVANREPAGIRFVVSFPV